MQGARDPPIKASSIDHDINTLMGGIVLLLITLCMVATGACTAWENREGENSWYLYALELNGAGGGDAASISCSESFIWGILYNWLILATFVSVSLYVSIGLCKWGQTYFMQQSLDMYDPESDTPMKVPPLPTLPPQPPNHANLAQHAPTRARAPSHPPSQRPATDARAHTCPPRCAPPSSTTSSAWSRTSSRTRRARSRKT